MIQKIECDTSMPSSLIMFDIANRLGVSVDYLFNLAISDDKNNFNNIIKEIKHYNEKHEVNTVEKLVNSISTHTMSSISVYDRQYIGYIKSWIQAFKYKDFEKASYIAEDYLLMSYDQKQKHYTNNEMLLINMLAKTTRNKKYYEAIDKALIFCEQNRPLVDDKVFLTLLNAKQILTFENHKWNELLDISQSITKIAINASLYLYITNSIFCEGVSLYKLNQKEEGTRHIIDALKLCKIYKQKGNYNQMLEHSWDKRQKII